ncbi:MAG: universal stress protein [Pseudomonadota bacterium]
MNPIKILVDMDPTQSQQPALYRAIELAKHIGAADIELLVVCYNTSIVSHAFFDKKRLQKAKETFIESQKRWLQTYTAEVSEHGFNVNIDVQWHKPLYEGIIKKANAYNADIVIKSTHKHSVVSRILFTPNDWQLLKTCSKPLWLAKNNHKKFFRKVLVAVDPSKTEEKYKKLDRKLIQEGKKLADKFSAEINVVHCYEPLAFEMFKEIGDGVAGYGDDFNNHQEYVEALEKHHRIQFKELIAPFDIAETHQFLLQGYPEICLPELVELKKMDIIVMGTSYHSGLVGSTTEKILDKLECDVVAIKPDDFDTIPL